jgi:hypothetical protein
MGILLTYEVLTGRDHSGLAKLSMSWECWTLENQPIVVSGRVLEYGTMGDLPNNNTLSYSYQR